jgi:hypothetical protein
MTNLLRLCQEKTQPFCPRILSEALGSLTRLRIGVYNSAPALYRDAVISRHGLLSASLLALVALTSAAPSPAAPPSEFRGLWVDAFGPGFFNPQQVKKLVTDEKRKRVNP